MANMYISPTGSGNHSGTSIENAAAIGNLNSMIGKAGAGGQVLLIADRGDYKVTGTLEIKTGGQDGQPVTIKGISSTGSAMDAHFVGTRPAVYAASNPSGNELFKMTGGSGNITFANMTIDNVGTAFRVGKDMANITIEHVDAHNVARFFENYASGSAKTATISGLTLRDVDVEGFSKGVVRLQYDTHDVLIENVRGDSMRQDGDAFAMGVHLDGTVHDVLISKTVMENATDTVGGTYWNGDGFATERGTYDITFQDTIARGNTDGGYDLKSMSTVLIRALAEDNARNYRIWGETTMIDSVALNPHLRGGSSNQAQVWVENTGKLTIEGGMIADAGSKTRVFENRGSVTVSDVDLIYADTAKLVAGNSVKGYSAADLTKLAATGGYSAVDFTKAVADLLSDAIKITAPVTTQAPAAPVTTAPVAATSTTESKAAAPAPVSAPAATIEAAIPVSKTAAASISTEQGVVRSTSANQTLTGTSANDIFSFTAPGKHGNDVIRNFGSDDLIVTGKALVDGNKDGIVTFGKDGKINLTGSAGTIKAADLDGGLRFLGSNSDGFFYGDAHVRPKGALEGKLFADNVLTGDAGDKAKTIFFVDTAVHRDLGDDSLRNFGARDALVTTSALDHLAVGGKLHAAAGTFSLHDAAGTDGSLAISNLSGKAVVELEFDGARTVGDVTYFVYSAVGSATDVHTLF